MLKRVSWFVSGAIAGIAGAGLAKRKVKKTAAQLTPTNIARTAAAKVREKGHDVADAVRDGREAMRAKEAELRAKLASDDDRADDVADDPAHDRERVDAPSGDPLVVAAGRVIVIEQPPEGEQRDDRTSPRRHSRRRPRRS